MIFRRLLNRNYLLDKRTNVVHDLLAIDSDNCFKAKIVPECNELLSTIKRKHRKYLTFNEFVNLYSKGEVTGCSKCLSGFDKK